MSARSLMKKQRSRNLILPSFGAASAHDAPLTQFNNPSSSASSTRTLPLSNIPKLTTFCARVFVINFLELRRNEVTWNRVSVDLAALPYVFIPKISAMLRNFCPTYLPHEFIVSYLFRGPSIVLNQDLPGVTQRTILDISRFNPGVCELELSAFGEISDKVFASLLRHLSALRVLVLRGCTKVGAQTVRATAESCPELRVLNLNYTSVSPASFIPLVTACPHLEVLKLAGTQNWTDATIANFFSGIDNNLTLPALRTLKLRQTSLSDTSLNHILSLCPSLQRLDISFTLVRHLPPIIAHSYTSTLQKLSLNSTGVLAGDLINAVKSLPELRTLAVGALGNTLGSRTSMNNSTAKTLNNETLRALSAVLEPSIYLECVTLVGNTNLEPSLSKHQSSLSDFITRVGRKCKKLNLAGIPSLRSSDLVGLVPTDGQHNSPLEFLILNNTGIDDEASPYLSTCSMLRTLGVAGTKMTRDGLFLVIDSCPKLENLDLTSCRGVRVTDRRRFFEVWQDAKLDV